MMMMMMMVASHLGRVRRRLRGEVDGDAFGDRFEGVEVDRGGGVVHRGEGESLLEQRIIHEIATEIVYFPKTEETWSRGAPMKP